LAGACAKLRRATISFIMSVRPHGKTRPPTTRILMKFDISNKNVKVKVKVKVKIKVKCTLVQALRLCTGPTAQRGIRGVALPFHDHGTRRG